MLMEYNNLRPIPDDIQQQISLTVVIKKIHKRDQYYVKDVHDPIIPREVYLHVQGLFLQHRQARRKGVLLQGMVICDRCGACYDRNTERKETLRGDAGVDTEKSLRDVRTGQKHRQQKNARGFLFTNP